MWLTRRCSSVQYGRFGIVWIKWIALGCLLSTAGASTSALFGSLLDLNKADIGKAYSDEQRLACCRSNDTPRPAMVPSASRSERGDLSYAKMGPDDNVLTGCLKGKVASGPLFWEGSVAPASQGKA